MDYQVDKMTGRKYLVADSSDKFNFSDQELNKDNVLVASYQNSARILLKNGTLVVVEDKNPIELYKILTKNETAADEARFNFMNFHMKGYFAVLELNCRSCDNSSSFHQYAHTNVRLTITTNPSEIFGYSSLPNVTPIELENNQEYCKVPSIALFQNIKFFITDSQAINVRNSLKKIEHLEKNDHYSLISWSHESAQILTDIYKFSGFDGHFSDYIKDEEITDFSPVNYARFGEIFLQRKYHDVADSNLFREPVTQFIEYAEGKISERKWWYKLSDGEVDKDKMKNFPDIFARFQSIKSIKNDFIPKYLRIVLEMEKINLTEKQFGYLVETLSKVTYSDLYYPDSLQNTYSVFLEYKDTPVFEKLFFTREDKYGFLDLFRKCFYVSFIEQRANCLEEDFYIQLYKEKYLVTEPLQDVCFIENISQKFEQKCASNLDDMNTYKHPFIYSYGCSDMLRSIDNEEGRDLCLAMHWQILKYNCGMEV